MLSNIGEHFRFRREAPPGPPLRRTTTPVPPNRPPATQPERLSINVGVGRPCPPWIGRMSVWARAWRTAASGGPVDRAAMERRLGLDLPIHVQYGR